MRQPRRSTAAALMLTAALLLSTAACTGGRRRRRRRRRGRGHADHRRRGPRRSTRPPPTEPFWVVWTDVTETGDGDTTTLQPSIDSLSALGYQTLPWDPACQSGAEEQLAGLTGFADPLGVGRRVRLRAGRRHVRHPLRGRDGLADRGHVHLRRRVLTPRRMMGRGHPGTDRRRRPERLLRGRRARRQRRERRRARRVRLPGAAGRPVRGGRGDAGLARTAPGHQRRSLRRRRRARLRDDVAGALCRRHPGRRVPPGPGAACPAPCTSARDRGARTTPGSRGRSSGRTAPRSRRSWPRHGVTDVDVVGLATDHCVAATASDARAAGFTATVLLDLTAAVALPTTLRAVARLSEQGVTLRTTLISRAARARTAAPRTPRPAQLARGDRDRPAAVDQVVDEQHRPGRERRAPTRRSGPRRPASRKALLPPGSPVGPPSRERERARVRQATDLGEAAREGVDELRAAPRRHRDDARPAARPSPTRRARARSRRASPG